MVTAANRVDIRRLYTVAVLSILCLFISGCWDQRELQERGFVLASAIDINDAAESPEKQQKIESFTHPQSGNPYRISLQMLRLEAGQSDEGGKKGGGKTYVLSNTGFSLHEIIRDMRGQTSKGIWFEHQQTIIFSEAALRQDGLERLIDLFRRDGEIRWRTQLYVTPGKASSLLEFKPPTGEASGIYFARIAYQYKGNPDLATYHTDLGFTVFAMDNEQDIILPRIEMVGDKVKVNGAALFKKNKLVGYIDEYAVKGRKFILGTARSALVSFECPQHSGGIVTFEMQRHHTVLKPHVEGESIYFTLDIAMRGNITEISCALKHDTTDAAYQKKTQELLAQEVQRNVAHGHQKARDMGVDVINFSKLLKAYHPKTWEKVKDRWDEIFPTIPLYASVKVALVNVGEHE